MVLDKLPSEVRKAGGVARTASIRIIEDIMNSVTIPVMANVELVMSMKHPCYKQLM